MRAPAGRGAQRVAYWPSTVWSPSARARRRGRTGGATPLPETVRLACQSRPAAPARVRRLVHDAINAGLAIGEAGGWPAAEEKRIGLLFCDISDFTTIVECQLAYDLVHSLNRSLSSSATRSSPTTGSSTSPLATACSHSSDSTARRMTNVRVRGGDPKTPYFRAQLPIAHTRGRCPRPNARPSCLCALLQSHRQQKRGGRKRLINKPALHSRLVTYSMA